MKKTVILAMALAVTGALAGVVMAAGDEIPAPFGKVREFCLQVNPGLEGVRLIVIDARDNGMEFEFRMALFPDSSIALSMFSPAGFKSVFYYEGSGKMTTLAPVFGRTIEVPVDEIRGFAIAWEIYRELVRLDLIPPRGTKT